MFSDVRSGVSSKYGEGSASGQKARMVFFWILAGLTTAVTVCVLVLLLLWVLVDVEKSGLEGRWTGQAKTFNWHPTLSIIGLLVIMSHSMLVYRFYSRMGCTSKIIQKSVHVFLMVVVAILLSVAYAAIVDYHHTQNFSDVRTMHSWLGITTGLFFFLQLIFSGFIFLLPFPGWVKQFTMPFHRAGGFGTLIIAAGTMLTGLQEQIGFDDATGVPDNESKIGQAMGLFILLVTVLVGFILSRPEYARYQPDHEELPEPGGEKVPLRPAY